MDYEVHLIGCCLLDNSIIGTAVTAGIEAEMFTDTLCRQIWTGISNRYAEGESVDIVWADNYAREKDGYSTLLLANAIDDILSPKTEAMSVIEIMKQTKVRESISDILRNANRRLPTEEPEIVRKEIVEQLMTVGEFPDDTEDKKSIELQIIAGLERGIEHSTGFRRLDYLTKGIEPGTLWVVGGGTSNGKTTFVLNVAHNLAKKDQHVTVFSTEMIKKHLIQRFATMISGVNPSISLSLTPGEEEAFKYGVHMALEYPVAMISTLSLPTIRMTMQKRESLLYIVDYLQMIDPGKNLDSEVKRLGYVVRELERLSKQYDICVMVTSQFNRNRDDVPRLSSYRGSGEIEENTDIGVLMYYPFQQATFEDQRQIKEQGKDNIINVSVQKNRIHGLTGFIKFDFDRSNMRMKEFNYEESTN